jgi:hypothetical protein
MSLPLPGSRPPATRTLSDLLLALAGTMQQLRQHPAGDPSVGGHAAALSRALAAALEGREELTVKVGRVQLVVDGMETNPDFEPLRHCAALLHDAGVGTIVFQPGATPGELLDAFAPVARGAVGDALPSPARIRFRPHRPSGPLSSDPWRALERLACDDPARPVAECEPVELAVGLELHPAGEAFDTRVLELLAQLAERASADPAEAVRLDRLIEELPAATLRRLLAPGRAEAPQREFLRALAPVAVSESLLRVAQALVPGREAVVSIGAVRLLARLAADADAEPAKHRLPAAFLRLVELLFDAGARLPRPAAEPERVLKLALESGILEAGALLAADRMVERRQIGPLLALLETVPKEDPVAATLRARLLHPRTVRALLQASPIDLDALDRMIPAVGLEAAPVLLDALAESRERRVRLRLLDLLVRYGQAVVPLVQERLEGMPWYVQRNLVLLLGRLPDLPPAAAPLEMLRHRDPRVRHEAIALMMADPELRSRAVAEALAGEYEPSLRLALTALAERCPPEFLPRVLNRIQDPELPPDVRALAVSAAATVKDPLVLRVLRRLVVARGITGMGRLAPRTAPMLAALRGLALHWSNHPKVAAVLDAARQSRDPEIREAARALLRRSGANVMRGTSA